MDLSISLSEVCIRDGEYCGIVNITTSNMSKTPCCDHLKCVTDAPHPCPFCEHDKQPHTFKCLDCTNEPNGICGGTNNIKCCPSFGCVRKNENDKTSFGQCLPYP